MEAAYEALLLIVCICAWGWFGYCAIMNRIFVGLIDSKTAVETADDGIEYIYYVFCGPFGWVLLASSFAYWLTNRVKP